MAFPRIKRLEASHSYGLLLALILVTLTFVASAPEAKWARLVGVSLQASILLVALWTSRTPERDFKYGLIAAAVALVATIAMTLSDQEEVNRGAVALVGALVMIVVPGVIAHGIYHSVRSRGVTLQAVFGVLCVYLLLGMLFAYGFGAVAFLQSGPLFTNGTEGDLQDHLYFSFTTLTTVGYGDLSPRGDLARALSIVEALVGQLYLVTVVAVIVGNFRRS